MRLWLDDIRAAPDGYVHARSVRQAIELMEMGEVTHASLDHDLGDYEHDGGDAFRLILWMAENNCWPSHGIRVHSANVVGKRRMLADIDHYSPYPVAYTEERGDWAPDAL